ncbi:MAG: hypothetical protein AAF449_23680 [Myxococcota bacterium]
MSVALIVLALASSPSLEGRWARKTVNVATSKLPVIGSIEAITTAYTLVDVRRTDRGYELTEYVCGLSTNTARGAVTNNYSRAFLKAVSGRKKLVRVEGNRWLEDESEPRLHGARNVASSEPLPERNSPALFDADFDGKPGLTVGVDGFVRGEVYIVERSQSSMRGTIEDRRIFGTVDWTSEQRVLGASRDMLDVQPTAEPANERSVFEMRRAPRKATCRQLLARKDKLFEKTK